MPELNEEGPSRIDQTIDTLINGISVSLKFTDRLAKQIPKGRRQKAFEFFIDQERIRLHQKRNEPSQPESSYLNRVRPILRIIQRLITTI